MAPGFDYDVVVAGAGPAGVATAIAMVRAEPSLRGRVLVLDRARFPRAKPCGGGLTGHIDEAMAALGLELNVPAIPSAAAIVRYGQYRRHVTLQKPVRVIRREEFDHSLVEQARSRGIEVREGSGLGGFTVEHDGVNVSLGKGAAPIRARVLVGADGVGSLVRKALDEMGEGDELASRSRRDVAVDDDDSRAGHRPIRLFRAEIPDRGWHRAEMLYDFTPMIDGARGYLWIFPVPGGRLNVGIMHDPSVPISGADLRSLLRARLADHGVTIEGGDRALRGWPAWGYKPTRRLASPRVITVGDAAGIDALTGEGIAVALEQGHIAGNAVARAVATESYGFHRYSWELRFASVGRDLSLDYLLSRMLYAGRDYRRWLSLVLHDDAMLEAYAARVSGSMVLADEWRMLIGALGRHMVHGRARMKATREAEVGVARWTAPTTDGRPARAAE